MNEKTNEEKIREYVWLHADKPPLEIQAGILNELGQIISLKDICEEKKEYLSADEPITDENTSRSPSSDEETIQRIAKALPSVTKKQILEIVRLKTTTRLGYRKIGQRLSPALGKDTVMRTWKMYQATSKPTKPSKIAKEEEELEMLRTQVAEKERLKAIQKEREALFRKVVLLNLETEGDDIVLRTAENELAKLEPETYRNFKQYCERERLSPKAALQKMGLTASNLIEEFDFWYELWAEDGISGMERLTKQLWLEIKAFLQEASRAKKQEVNKEAKTYRRLPDETDALRRFRRPDTKF